MRAILCSISIAALLLAGCGGSGGGSTPPPPPSTAATPTFTPAAGAYTSAQSVTLADATTGATIYYTADGSTPTAASTKYTSAIAVSATTTIKAIATASGYTDSAVASATYTINLPAAATPVFSPAPGTFTATQSVTISSATTTATVYYTTDGSTPAASSTKYTSAISIGATTTIKAIATASGYADSAVSSATYTINLPAAATPVFSPAPGTFTEIQSVTISSATTGATVYYTTDGSTPTASSTKYTSAISISATATVKAIATASGYTDSAVASATFTINLPPATAPTFSPSPGTYNAPQSVTISSATTGATVYYTTDGSTPTTSSTKVTGTVSVAADTKLEAIAVAPGYTQSAAATGAYLIAGPTMSLVLSKGDQSILMIAQTPVTFTTNSAGTNKIIVDETQTYQTMEGFGASFTDSAAYLLENVVPAGSQAAVLDDLFTRNGNGIGLSFMRIPMGASDIARSIYSFDDQSGTATDPTLADFSIAHDQAYVLPLIQAAISRNPDMKLMANPWSPPGWMKSTDSMIGGTLLPTMDAPFANYFVKYLKAYEAAGVPIDYISLQNEPLYQPPAYPGMGMDATTQLGVLRDYVLPALTTNGLTTKVLVYDHNWDQAAYPETVLADPAVLASPLVAGTAWHGYGGSPGAQQTLQNMFPTKGNWETEHSGGTWISNQFQSDFVEITEVLRNAGKAYVKWSLALDENLGPNLTTAGVGGGCSTCTPIVTVNSKTGVVTNAIEYYTMGHFSKYVLPGATRIYSSNANGLDTVAFQNPDASKVLVAFNNSTAAITFQVQWGVHAVPYTLPAMSAATFKWAGTQSGIATTPAKSQIQTSSYWSQTGMAMETTSDTTGGYDMGYLQNGAAALYKSVDFGAGVAQVNLRAASAGTGGTAEFHLDSATGPLAATVTLPVTGGWQTWQTVNATVSGATGVHDLYLVISSGASGNIANLSWFQFQ